MRAVQINQRQLLLITEALERLDPDTLNDDLPGLGEEDTSGEELDEVVRHLREEYATNSEG